VKSFNELEKEAKKAAAIVRAEAGIGYEPIPDIFNFIEGLDILYVRYPAGDQVIEGYTASRGGRKVIFTNSSYIKGKEIFTAAHELGHLYMDLPELNVVIDEKISFDNPSSWRETRANIFAANFLMPESTVFSFFKDRIRVEPSNVTAKHIVWLQQHFRVSYQAALYRMKALSLISKEAFDLAINYGGCPTLSELVKKCGYDTQLLIPENNIGIPAFITQKVIELYENEKIPYGSLSYFFGLLKKEPKEFGICPREAGEEDAGD
jgi:Zn-dependent peptidase ImmA (M78 family)